MNTWPTKKMVEVTRLVTDGKHGDCEDEEGSGYYFLSSKDLRDGKLQYDNPRQITRDGFAETHRRTNLEPGDILLANCGASIGRVGIAQNDPRIFKTTFQKSVSVIKANRAIIDNRFLYYFIAFKSSLLIRLGNGAAQPNLLIGDLKKIEIPVPKLPIQRKIAEILTAYDELIENSQRRIQILEQMARNLYREWFVNFRFPGHAKAQMVDSPLGKIPKGWEIKPLEAIITEHIGGGWGKEEANEDHTEPAWVIRGTDIPEAKSSQVVDVPHRFHTISNLRSRRLEVGDIVFEVSGGSKGQPVGRTLLITSELLSALNGDVICASFCKVSVTRSTTS